MIDPGPFRCATIYAGWFKCYWFFIFPLCAQLALVGVRAIPAVSTYIFKDAYSCATMKQQALYGAAV